MERRGFASVNLTGENAKMPPCKRSFLKIIRHSLFRDNMGILDWLSGNKSSGSTPAARGKAFRISYEFNPLRLKAHKDSKISMNITLENTSGNKQLSSVDVEIARGNKVGFDVTSMQKHHEERLGELEPGAKKTFSVHIHSSPMTKPGDVPLKITAYSHYLNYSKVLEQAQKNAKLRVI
jgi:hypothetical protein